MGIDNSTINNMYKEALQAFIERTRNDDQIIAAILLGSLSYDQVWEKSDIDMKLIVHDQKLIKRGMCFVENGIPINASIQAALERIVQFIVERELELYRPIIDYLKQEQDVRSISEMAEKLGSVVRLDTGTLKMACSWLVNRGYILLFPTEAKATPKSRVYLEEPAYLLDDENEYI